MPFVFYQSDSNSEAIVFREDTGELLYSTLGQLIYYYVADSITYSGAGADGLGSTSDCYLKTP